MNYTLNISKYFGKKNVCNYRFIIDVSDKTFYSPSGYCYCYTKKPKFWFSANFLPLFHSLNINFKTPLYPEIHSKSNTSSSMIISFLLICKHTRETNTYWRKLLAKQVTFNLKTSRKEYREKSGVYVSRDFSPDNFCRLCFFYRPMQHDRCTTVFCLLFIVAYCLLHNYWCLMLM